LRTTFGFILRNIRLMLRNRWQRFGYACVNFGAPISARAYCRGLDINFSRLPPETRFAEVEKLGQHLMSRVERLVPALPVALVAAAVLEAPAGQSEFDLKARVYRRIERLRQQGAVVIVPSHTRAFTVDTALRMLLRRRLVVDTGGRYLPDPESLSMLRYYANAIATWRE
jgi:glycerol-3-phosphate O-acyltransferase